MFILLSAAVPLRRPSCVPAQGGRNRKGAVADHLRLPERLKGPELSPQVLPKGVLVLGPARVAARNYVKRARRLSDS